MMKVPALHPRRRLGTLGALGMFGMLGALGVFLFLVSTAATAHAQDSTTGRGRGGRVFFVTGIGEVSTLITLFGVK